MLTATIAAMAIGWALTPAVVGTSVRRPKVGPPQGMPFRDSRGSWLLVGSCPSLGPLLDALSGATTTRCLGPFHLPGEIPHGLRATPPLTWKDLCRSLREGRPDRVILCPGPGADPGALDELLALCRRRDVPVDLYPTELAVGGRTFRFDWKSPPRLRPVAAAPSRRGIVKRVLDVTGAALGLVLVAPLLAVVAATIRCGGRGPVLYRQTRVGCNGRLFTCLKFRTMKVDAERQQEALRESNEQDGPAFKLREDPRTTRFGRLLRKYSIDELPQLWNVLRGEMSLVGPRPPIPREVQRYEYWQRRRTSVMPGITCIWQVWGRNKVSFERWVQMDLQYIEKRSLWMDCKLIVHTFRSVLRGSGM